MSDWKALRAVDFNWLMRLESVWEETGPHVPDLNRPVREEILAVLDEMEENPDAATPLGRILVGGAGAGKTHMLASLQREIRTRDSGFILIDMTDVKDFWETALLGYLSSLQQPFREGRTQGELLLEGIIRLLLPKENPRSIVDRLPRDGTRLKGNIDRIIGALSRRYGKETRQHHDVLRAVFLLHAKDIRLSNLGYSWLQGIPLEAEDRRELGFIAASKAPVDIIKGLSWLMSLQGPTLVALDQLDSIVQQHHTLSGTRPDGDLADEQLASLSIIEGIGNGLSALVRSAARRTLAVVTCFESTWEILRGKALKSDTDSYQSPKALQPLTRGEISRQLIEARLRHGFDRIGFTPAYPSWPFRPEAFAGTASMAPREILMLCDSHRKACIRQQKAIEISDFAQAQKEENGPGAESGDHPLDQCLKNLQAKAPIPKLLDEKNEDALLCPLLRTACRCLIRERPPAGDVDAAVDTSFGGGRNFSPLHARIRLIHRDQDDLEKHYCIRAVQKHHPIAFQARVKAAVTASGIDRNLKFRHLILVRTGPPPSGEKSEEIVARFHKAGGRFVSPDPEELGTLWALYRMEKEAAPDFGGWLRSREPVSGLKMMKDAMLVRPDHEPEPSKPAANGAESHPRPQERPALPEPEIAPNPKPGPAPAQNPERKPKPASPAVSDTKPFSGQMPLGRILEGGRPVRTLTVDPGLLARHVVVLAGSGSGKTVLVRRLVEEAALLGIPSILIDGANDLSRMGDPWPEGSESRTDTDRAKARRFHKETETVIWTPGREKGNPLTLEPLPDLTAVADDPDELEQAVTMAMEAFREIAAPGNSLAARKKLGILSAALHHFAKGPGGGLEEFVAFLSDLPHAASGEIGDAPKVAREIADSIRAAVQTNPLLRQRGAAMDPGMLFGEENREKTRISVINFVGLPQPINQQVFLNQLSMTLFSWIKKHPAAGDRPIRGLFVIDEARDFVPSVRAAPCKTSLLRLTAQARKYGLGMVFATQSPKDLDHTVVTNCATQYYGKASSPNAINVIADQLRLRGGDGADIPALKTGRFYLYTENLDAPAKVQVPLCLSHHPPNPLNETEVLERAARSRRRMGLSADNGK